MNKFQSTFAKLLSNLIGVPNSTGIMNLVFRLRFTDSVTAETNLDLLVVNSNF